MDDETLRANKEKYKGRIREWWKKTAGLRRPNDVSRIQEELHRDRERLFAVCKERLDGAELVDCIHRLTENAYAFAHYAGIRRGYKIGVEVGKDASEEKIIKILRKNLDATSAEICKLIDAHNAPFANLNDIRRIHIVWPDLAKKGTLWERIAGVQKVKQYLYRARTKARQMSRIDAWQDIMREHEMNRKK